MTLTTKFRFTRETKNTLRYDEIVDEVTGVSISDALYIKKAAIRSQTPIIPQVLHVSISEVEEG